MKDCEISIHIMKPINGEYRSASQIFTIDGKENWDNDLFFEMYKRLRERLPILRLPKEEIEQDYQNGEIDKKFKDIVFGLMDHSEFVDITYYQGFSNDPYSFIINKNYIERNNSMSKEELKEHYLMTINYLYERFCEEWSKEELSKEKGES